MSQSEEKNKLSTEEKSDSSVDEKTETPDKKPMTWKGRLFSWSWQLVVILIIYIGVTSWMTRSLLASGKVAPAFHLKDLKGNTHTLAKYRGKQVVLHFWATWCGVCKANVPVLKWMASSYRTNPVLLTVVQDTHNMKKILELKRAKGMNYPILLSNVLMLKKYKVSQYPTTYFIDKNGRVFSKDVGWISPFGFWWRSWISGVKTWLGM